MESPSYFFGLLICVALVSTSEATDVFAKVEQGLLRGVRTTSILGTEYNRFFGVPYAAPPVGDLRFRAPQPPSNWSGVRDALSEPLQCPQMWPGESSEDCLYLNVYAPAGGVDLPIMLMIYGGAFQGGSSSTNLYGPDFIVDHGVILVTFNYRSGVLGYLSLQTEEIPGNAGLKDAVAALRWVQRNGAAFGGDARRVTLFGASSGGCSVSHLLLSPATPGLFQQVIIQSGEAIAPWGLERNPREKAFRLAASMGFETDDLQELTQFLKAADALELTANDSRGLSDIELRSLNALAFVPVVEPPSPTAIIVEDPALVLKEGRFHQVPVMTGVDSADGSVLVQTTDLFNNPKLVADVRENFTTLVGQHLHLPTEQQRAEAAAKLQDFYFKGKGFSLEDPQAVYDMISDIYYIEPCEAFVQALVKVSSAPVYYYHYDYDGWGYTEYGAPHCIEIYYLFNANYTGPSWDIKTKDGRTRQLLVKLWTNFAKSGRPSTLGFPTLWMPYTRWMHNYLHMGSRFSLKLDPAKKRMDFWRKNIPF
ncbi:esterase B1-like [Schistocerca nitens]|uniref:esterase B1-like n=1 Tax=Schistocerca nitens TaxID=7011 RepID=UPI00211860A9|nr:esterase B1-like [Schistocerca nitens]